LEDFSRPLNILFFNSTKGFENSEDKEPINEKDCNIEEIFKDISKNSNNLSDDEEIPEGSFLNIKEALRAGYIFEVFEEVLEIEGVFEIIEEGFEYMRRFPRKSKHI
jgi:hypothetical protein